MRQDMIWLSVAATFIIAILMALVIVPPERARAAKQRECEAKGLALVRHRGQPACARVEGQP
jgi:hypothetical protein